MKVLAYTKLLFSAVLFAVIAWGVILPTVTKAVGGFVVESFDSQLVVQTDGRVAVTETIEVNFNDPLHGIYRDIPLRYRTPAGIRYMKLIPASIALNGRATQYQIIESDDVLRFKIGNPDQRISGKQIYTLRYVAEGIINTYPDYDELGWNVTGNNWEVPINKVTASLTLPAAVHKTVTCYEGFTTSTDKCPAVIDNTTALFAGTRAFSPGEGLTIFDTFDTGSVPILTVEPPVRLPGHTVFLYLLLGFGGMIIICGGILFWLWWKKGRDEYYQRKSLHDPNQQTVIMPLFGAVEPIVPEYEPPLGLLPAQLRILLDEEADILTISATVVDLAVRGYVIIKELEKRRFAKQDYELTRTAKTLDDLLPYERRVIEVLFGKKQSFRLSDFSNISGMQKKILLQSDIKSITDAMYVSLEDKKLFHQSPERVRLFYLVGAVASILISLAATIGFIVGVLQKWQGHTWSWLIFGALVGWLFTSFVFVFLSRFMPKRTAYGRDIYRQALGYKLFVSGTEKYRQPFFEKEGIFSQVLPYAMIFGVTRQLSQAMKDMGVIPTQNWYVGSPGSSLAFVDTFPALSQSFSAAMTSQLSSGMSGGVGGGAGGGGGGGW